MRKGVAGIGLGCLALVVVACGGNVVVDGTTTTTSGSTSGSSGAGASAACSNLSGEQLSNGGCQADAQCGGESVLIQCNPNSSTGGSTCLCEVNGSPVGSCQEASGSSNTCNPTNGCCGVFFNTSGG
jgi:hypothetical protein